jgi:putative DNA primase/helicase
MPTEGTITFNLTDMGNAERLANHYGDRLRYCYETKRWLIWTGKSWEWDIGGRVNTYAKVTVRNIYHEAGDEIDDKARKEVANHAKHSESDHRINAMISLAQSEPGIPVRLGDLDTDPWLFNCLNGTIDLRTSSLLPHRKEDLITILVPVDYQPDAQCPLWLSFLDRVTGGDAALASYLQRAVGYSLTGDTRSQVMFLLYGLGNNGKSTFTMTIRKLMAGYAERLDAEDLMLKEKGLGGGPKEGIASLKNKRLVVGSELQDGKRLDVSLVKDMTGGETVKARRLYEHDFEFMPTFKLWLYGNHKPVIADTTLSIWRRVKQIPFEVTIPNSEVDPDLPMKLEAEFPGILAWVVKGCMGWQRYGLGEPEVVTTATAKYRHEQDILGDFIEDCCILEPLAVVPKSELREKYQEWCQENSIEPVTQRTFKARLMEKGISDYKGTGGQRHWKGIRVATEKDFSGKSGKTSDILNVNGRKGQDFTQKSLMKENLKKFTEKPPQDATFATNNPATSEGFRCHCGCTESWIGPGGQELCVRCHPEPKGVTDGE